MKEQLYVISTLIFLVFTYVMYSQKTLNKHQFLVLRLVYYGYWYWLLYIDASKYIIVMLTFGYLIITSMQPPTLTQNEQEDKVNTYILGYRRGFERGVKSHMNMSNDSISSS